MARLYSNIRNYFCRVKVQLLTIKDGIPIVFHFTLRKTDDKKALGKMIDKLSIKTSIYGDCA